MDGFHLTAFDAAALAIIIISAVMALARGFLREMFSIVAFLVGGVVTIFAHPYVRPLFAGWVNPPIAADLVAGFGVFLIVFAAVTIAGAAVVKSIHNSSEVGALDRGAGFAFGVARGILVVTLAVVLFRIVFTGPDLPMPGFMSEARLYPAFERLAMGVESVGRTMFGERAPPTPAPEPNEAPEE